MENHFTEKKSIINSVSLNFKKYSTSKDSLVILHGLFGCLDNWHTLASRYSESLQVITCDQRNHGRSPHSNEFGYLHMAEDLKKLLDDQQIKEIDLMGHSMGGKTAMTFAFQYPQYLKKLIVVDMAPKAYPPQHSEIIEALESVDFNNLKTRQDIDAHLKKSIPINSIRLFLMKNLTRNQEGQLSWKINLPAIKQAYPSLNESITTHTSFNKPTLFIRGEKSSYIKDADETLIRKLFPQAQIATIKSAGHWVHAEASENFYQITQKFLMTSS